MTNKLMLGAALGALMISGAVAQTPTPPAGSTATPPAATAPAPAEKSAAPAEKADKAAAPAATTASGEFINTQKPDQWLASKFKGTDVLGSDNEKIGDISDIMFDKAGKIDAYIVSVGGFLGMGAKEVAMAPSAFEVVPGENGGSPKLKTSMTKDQLKNAQNFARYEPPRPAATTGAAPGGPRPSSNTGPTGR